MPAGLLGIEEIRKIIQFGKNENIEDFARKLGVNDSAMEAFIDCVYELIEFLDIFDEDEVMNEFIVPFVEDQTKMLKEKEK
jgi:hypothetical protein